VARANRSFFGQFAWVSGGRLLAAALQAVSLIFVARFLAPAEFGVLATVVSLATVLQAVLDFGVGTYITRERAANPNSGGIATALRFNAVTSTALAAIVVVGLSLMGLFVSPTYFLMLPLAFWLSGERNADARLTVVFADGDAWINVTNLLSRRLAGLIGFLALVSVGVEPLFSYSLALAVAAIASSLFANVYVRRRVDAAPSLTYRELIGESVHYWANSVATQARNLDVVIVGALAGSVAAGFYASASRLTTPLRILPTSLASVLIPAATRAVSAGRSLSPLLKSAAALLAGVTFLYALIYVAAPWFVPLALGDAYVPAIPVIQIVLLGLPFAACASLCNALLQAIGEKRFVATAATISTVFCLVAVALATIAAGAVGAAWALTASFALQAILAAAKLVPSVRPGSNRGED
jgi:O-antigen/teichoic acid export membrane protein